MGEGVAGTGSTPVEEAVVSRYVVDVSVVLHLLRSGTEGAVAHELLAPTLMRSQLLETLFRAVRSGALSEEVALDELAGFSRMKVRFLGDKVLRRKAWAVATAMGWESTGWAEYVALVQLQAVALATLDREFAEAARGAVPVVPVEALF